MQQKKYTNDGNHMTPFIGQLTAIRIRFRTLATLRDTLLPKLLSGEVDVGFAGKQVEAVL